MKPIKFAVSTAVAIATLAMAATNAQAFIFVDQSLDVLETAPAGEDDLVFTLTEQGVTSIPFDTGVFTTGAGATVNINNNVNDLSGAIGDIVYRLFGDAQFGQVTSNLYDVTLSEDNQVATFSGAKVNPGELFRINRSITDGAPVDFQVTLATANESNVASVATVPEPATITGLVLVGLAGLGSRRIKQLATEQ